MVSPKAGYPLHTAIPVTNRDIFMSNVRPTHAPFSYQVETSPVPDGGRAWSVFHRNADGRRVILASGTLLGETGQLWDHDSLVSFVQAAEGRRSSVN